MKIDYEATVDFVFSFVETFSRQDVGWILAGYRNLPSHEPSRAALARLQRMGVVLDDGRGPKAKMRLAPEARQRLLVTRPQESWSKPWAGKWRVVTYDLPLPQRKDRYALWDALRANKFGLLQQSVWLWPHDLEPILQEIVLQTGLPECFCGFEAGRLFLCDDRELVSAAWDFEEIGRRHQTYVKHLVATPTAAKSVSDLKALGRLLRIESDAYQYAFTLDPLLPRELCPRGYKGFAVEERHCQFRAAIGGRLRQLASA